MYMVYNYAYLRCNKVMVKFIQGNGTSFMCQINNITRFHVIESGDFTGGWVLYTLKGVKIRKFTTLCEVENYIGEMDK